MSIVTFSSGGDLNVKKPIYWFNENGEPTQIQWGYWFDAIGTPHLVYGSGPDWLYLGGDYNVTADNDKFNTDYITGFTNTFPENQVTIYSLSGEEGHVWNSKTYYSHMIVNAGTGGDIETGTQRAFSIITEPLPSATLDMSGTTSMTISGFLIIGGSAYGGCTTSGNIDFVINGNRTRVAEGSITYGTPHGEVSNKEIPFTFIINNLNLQPLTKIQIYIEGNTNKWGGGNGNGGTTSIITSITCNTYS